MAPNRIVALATPLAAPLAGAFAAWISQHFPGAEAQQGAIEETFLAVTAAVLALALQFNHNRFKWDVAQQAPASGETTDVAAPDALDVEPLDVDDLLDDDLDDLDDELTDEDDQFDDELDGAAGGVLLDGEDELAAGDAQSHTTTIR